MVHNFIADDETEEAEDPNDEDATLADDLLDEVTADDEAEEDAVEGFGIIPETEEEEEEDDEEEDADDEELEDDAEDVDFDTFDDVDEL